MTERDDRGAATRAEGQPAPATPSSGVRPHQGMDVAARVRLKGPLGQGGMAEVWVADHLTLGNEVAVKFLRGEHDTRMRERFTREAQLAARIEHPHAVRVFDHGLVDGTPFMVMERVDGETLAARIRREGGMRPKDVEAIVDQVAQVLTYAHEMGIVHRDIKPHNIMLARGDRVFAKVLDFGLAKTLVEEEDDALTQAGWVLGTPAYMSPEQLVEAKPATARSDRWALAVVAYEMLCGKRPFRGHSQAALALAMLTERYDRPSSARPDLPEEIDAWFERAWHTDVDKRFPDASEMSAAFSDALRGASRSVFVDGRIRLPSKLYGREDELTVLAQALQKSAERSRLLLIAGYSGVGKTALVEETRRRFADAGVLFASGKADQFNRGTPYDPLRQALRKLARHLGSGSDASTWRERIDAALGENAGVLTDFLPELEDLIGERPGPTDTPPTEARNRFQRAVSGLLHAVADPERPLVVFLDDLQWADRPTLDMLGHLAQDPEARGVLVIGSYRENEIDAHDPLGELLRELREGSVDFDELAVGPLGEDAVLEMVTDALGPVPGRVRLAVLCHEKTRGNPFFLRRFLEALHDDGLLTFDREEARWSWSNSQVLAKSVGEDVVAFIAAEMRRLPDGGGECLALASCIGGHFDLGTLAFLLDTDRRRALESLRPALAAHLVVPGSEDAFSTGGDLGPRRVSFRFGHDRIHQAARSLVDDARAAEIHAKIAGFLLEHLEPHEREARLFELVEHFNRGADAIVAPVVADPAQLRRLNLHAARRASRSAAFEPAAGFYQKALAHFEESQWDEAYPEALALHIEAARSAYLDGRPEEMRRLVERTVQRARTKVDEVRAREVEMHGLIQEQRLGEAVTLAVELLRELGSPMAAEPTTDVLEAMVGATLERMATHTREQLAAAPSATDERIRLAQRIRQGAMSAAYLAKPLALPLLAGEIIRSTVEDGVADQSAYGFAAIGIALNAVGLIDQSYEAGKFARALLPRSSDRSLLAQTQHVLFGMVNPFKEPIGESVEHEQTVHQIGVDTGDLEYASWALHLMVANGFYAGRRLGAVREMARKNRALLEQYRQLPALSCHQPFEQAIENCIGDDIQDSSRLVSTAFHEDHHMDELLRVGFRGAAYILTVMRTFVRFLFRDTRGALEAAEAGAEYVDGAVATYHPIWWHQLRALAVLDVRGEDGIADAKESLARLEAWCAASEPNHLHRVAIVRGEIARVEGRDADALTDYDAAIAHAREHGFLHEEALANELAARCYLGRGSATGARAYLLEARDAYEDWGARAKVAQLEAELGDVLRRSRR